MLIPPLSVIIMCESWPAWLFALRSLRVDCSHLYVFSLAPPWLPLLQRAFPQLNVSVAVHHPPLIVEDTWILLSGSVRWLSTILPYYTPSYHCLASIAYSSPLVAPLSVPAVSMCKFDSRLAGSVMNHEWHFVIPSDFGSVEHPAMYSRPLTHIIDPTVRPSGMPSSEATTPNGDGHLSWSSLFSRFRCRSVYTRSGVVIRPLTPIELSRAYDLPSWVGQSFACFPPQDLPWLPTPPVKLLCHVGWCVLRGGGGGSPIGSAPRTVVC
jgi:hypothetical protein